jgi:hypothetical protein
MRIWVWPGFFHSAIAVTLAAIALGRLIIQGPDIVALALLVTAVAATLKAWARIRRADPRNQHQRRN